MDYGMEEIDEEKMNCMQITGVPFLKHLFYEYYVYVDSEDYKADYILIHNNVKGHIIGEWCHPKEKYKLIEIRVKKNSVKAFEDSMEQLANKQLISGNSDYLDNADAICRKLLKMAKGL